MPATRCGTSSAALALVDASAVAAAAGQQQQQQEEESGGRPGSRAKRVPRNSAQHDHGKGSSRRKQGGGGGPHDREDATATASSSSGSAAGAASGSGSRAHHRKPRGNRVHPEPASPPRAKAPRLTSVAEEGVTAEGGNEGNEEEEDCTDDEDEEGEGAGGPEGPGVLLSRAMALFDKGEIEAALPLLEKTVDLRRASLGEQHADTLTALDRQAACLYNLERYEEALPLFEKVLPMTNLHD